MPPSKTRDFGSSFRENHDSSDFYDSNIYDKLASGRESDGIESQFPKDIENRIIQGDCRDLSIIPDLSLHLVVTSPPYNVSKIYDNDLSLDEYLNLLRDTFEEIYDKLVDGGRICLNIANIGRKPYIPLSDYISRIMIELGYIHRGEIIWDKGASAGASTAWGSWQSATNPFLRDVHEYILVFSKSTLKRSKHGKSNTISKEEFLEYTKSVWTFETASARRIGHPAPFPIELPYRCIQLYSLSDDMVFDPFAGSGQTAIAAIKSGRRFFGMDIDEEYVYLAQDRIDNYKLGIFEE